MDQMSLRSLWEQALYPSMLNYAHVKVVPEGTHCDPASPSCTSLSDARVELGLAGGYCKELTVSVCGCLLWLCNVCAVLVVILSLCVCCHSDCLSSSL